MHSRGCCWLLELSCVKLVTRLVVSSRLQDLCGFKLVTRLVLFQVGYKTCVVSSRLQGLCCVKSVVYSNFVIARFHVSKPSYQVVDCQSCGSVTSFKSRI